MGKMAVSRQQKRDSKFAERPLKSFNTLYVYFRLLTSFRTLKVSVKFLYTVFINYLALQFLEKWGFYNIPVVKVDHPLDKKIPFTPSKVYAYMDFVPLFLRPVSMLLQRYGIKKAAPIANGWFSSTAKLYKEAGRMYKHTLSTTDRPIYKENSHFRTIHRLDPHFLCVPSLHIALIALTTVFFKKEFKQIGLSDAESFQKNTEIYNEAIEIAEAVLYIKQHSVNCIPSALYMTTKLFPELFSPNDATNFINDMFLTAQTISPKDCMAIKEHISFMYERFLLEGIGANDWREPVIRWIENYKAPEENTGE
ncbi:hypothetical protein [Treponema pectinovorum]|uniref:hypothetical protein n=1 Tax=Treponema pectinovorum TaxID=164 RepID=UPI0011CC76EB|nr:hypothetical protein [Treponema pectinovorum]